MLNIKREILKQIKEKMNLDFLKLYVCVSFIYSVGLMTIFRANFNYYDDVGRITYGYRSWGEWYNRYFSEYFSILVHANTVLIDISPITQILALLIMSLAFSIVVSLFTKRFSVFHIIASIPFCLSPYFLSCLSFKFDSPYMAFSVLMTIVPFIFYHGGFSEFIIATMVGALLMCISYQASNGIYFVLLVLYSLHLWLKGYDSKWLFRKAFHGIISYLAILMLYKKVFVKMVDNGYATTATVSPNDFVATIYSNSYSFMQTFIGDFPNHWLILVGMVLVASIVIMACNSNRNKLVSIAIFFFLVICCVSLSQGVFLLLRKPFLVSRGMYSIWIAISIIMVMCASYTKYINIYKCLCFFLCWCLFGFAFIFGNALNEQKEYAERRMNLVISDLNKSVFMDKEQEYYLKFEGSIGNAPVVKRMCSEYPVLKRSVPILLYGSKNESGTLFNDLNLFNCYDMKNVQKGFFSKKDIDRMNFTRIVSSAYHDIDVDRNNRCVLVTLK